MSKKEKKSKKESKLAKLKKIISKLKLFEKKLKTKELKIDKELKKSKSKDIKKSKIKALKEKKAGSSNEAKKVSVELKEKKKELKKAKKKKEDKKPKSKTKAPQNKKEKEAKDVNRIPEEVLDDSSELNAEDEVPSSADVAIDSMPISMSFNTKDAIAYLRKLPTIVEIENFVKNDKRVTVKKATVSRFNALRKKEE